MADNSAICLLAAMDRLWFHQVVLLSEPTPETLKTPEFIPVSNISQPFLLDEQISSLPSALSPDAEDDEDNQHHDDNDGPIRFDLRLNSSSPLDQIHPKRPNPCSSGPLRRLQKTMSCKSLSELELEEVKGFMDLGFEFNKAHLSPRMMSVVPGLQRLGLCMINEQQNGLCDGDDEEREKVTLRPYLSEAWLLKRPDSPLLNLRIPVTRVFEDDDMKKHLRFWARTVAFVIQQES